MDILTVVCVINGLMDHAVMSSFSRRFSLIRGSRPASVNVRFQRRGEVVLEAVRGFRREVAIVEDEPVA